MEGNVIDPTHRDYYGTAHHLVSIGFWEPDALPVHTVKATCTFSMPNASADTCVRNLWFDGVCGNCKQKSRFGYSTAHCPKCEAAISAYDTFCELAHEVERDQMLRDYWADQ